MAPLRYLIVGSGYRAEYYGRIAMMYPELFRAMYLCRSEEKTARMTKNTGCPATVSREEALAFGPDFIVEAVDRSHGSDVSLEWAERGFPVMAETPVAASWAQWKAVRAAGKRRADRMPGAVSPLPDPDGGHRGGAARGHRPAPFLLPVPLP